MNNQKNQREKINNVLNIQIRIKREHPAVVTGGMNFAQETDIEIIALNPKQAGEQMEKIAEQFLSLK